MAVEGSLTHPSALRSRQPPALGPGAGVLGSLLVTCCPQGANLKPLIKEAHARRGPEHTLAPWPALHRCTTGKGRTPTWGAVGGNQKACAGEEQRPGPRGWGLRCGVLHLGYKGVPHLPQGHRIPCTCPGPDCSKPAEHLTPPGCAAQLGALLGRSPPRPQAFLLPPPCSSR